MREGISVTSMISVIRTMLACLIIVSVIRIFEAKPFKVAGKKFVYVDMQDGVGNYNFTYEDKDQLVNRTEMGKIVETKLSNVVLMVNGSYTNAFNRGDCQTIVVKYSANENGFTVKFSYEEKIKGKAEENGMVVSACPAYRAQDEPNISTDCIRSLAGGCAVG